MGADSSRCPRCEPEPNVPQARSRTAELLESGLVSEPTAALFPGKVLQDVIRLETAGLLDLLTGQQTVRDARAASQKASNIIHAVVSGHPQGLLPRK